MKKQLTFILLAVIALCVMCTAVSAYGDYPLLIDESNLLSSDDQNVINATLEEYSDQYDMDIVIVTVDSLNGNTATESADYVFDNYGYDYYDFSTGGGYGDEVTISRSANHGSHAIMSIFGGLIIGLISTSKMKKEMNNVKMNAGATAYVRKDSLNLTGEKDMFLYKNVSRTRRDTETRSGGGHHGGSVHVSSGGHSHGGGSGHF